MSRSVGLLLAGGLLTLRATLKRFLPAKSDAGEYALAERRFDSELAKLDGEYAEAAQQHAVLVRESQIATLLTIAVVVVPWLWIGMPAALITGAVFASVTAFKLYQASDANTKVREIDEQRKEKLKQRPRLRIAKDAVPQLLQQYQAYLQDLGNIGTRQTQTNAWYVSILSALVALIAYLAKEARLQIFSYVSIAAAALVGIALCSHWRNHTRAYQHLYNAKFAVLHDMEEAGLPFHCYGRESRLMHPGRRRFTSLEASLTHALTVPFLLLLLFALWKVIETATS